MPTLICELARVYDDAVVRVDRLRLSCSCRIVDGSMNVTVYGNDLCFVFYMLRNMRRTSLHRVVGSVACSAYISQNANRANYSARVGPDTIEPLSIRDHVPVIGAEMITSGMVNIDKLAFVLRLFILQNWDATAAVPSVANDKVEFAREVLRLQSVLITLSLLPGEVEMCCNVENVQVTTTTPVRPAQVTSEEIVVLNTDFIAIRLKSYKLSVLLGPGPLVLTDI